MTPYRGPNSSRINRDRRADSFARFVIGEAERRRRLGGGLCLQAGESPATSHLPDCPNATDGNGELVNSYRPWGCTCEDKPIGQCSHCSAFYYDEGEQKMHEGAECIGGNERFR